MYINHEMLLYIKIKYCYINKMKQETSRNITRHAILKGWVEDHPHKSLLGAHTARGTQQFPCAAP